MSDERTVDEGFALMVAWCRYLGVDDNVTVIPSADFVAGFRAALGSVVEPSPAKIEKAAEALRDAGLDYRWDSVALGRAVVEALATEGEDNA